MTQSQNQEPLTYTVEELCKNTLTVMREIFERNEPAIIAHHGAFKFLIKPLDDAEVLSTVLDQLVEKQGVNPDKAEKLYTFEEIMEASSTSQD